MVSRSRMPPPSCTGILLPTSRRMALMAGFLPGLPAKAPLRSTRCRRRAPASSQRRAIAAGSSPNVVESFISPCLRRTHLPSFRSIAGISSMAVVRVGGEIVGTLGALGSRLPEQEIAVQGQPVLCALLGMELGSENVIPGYSAGKADTVFGFAGAVLGIVHNRMVA